MSILFCVWAAVFGYAQTLTVNTSQVEYEDDEVASVQVKVSPDRSSLQDAFEDWMDDNYDVKMRRKGLFGDKEIRQAEAVRIPSITSDQINLYTKTVEEEEYTEMSLFASRGLANYIELDEDQAAFEVMENMMATFLASYLPSYYEERVEQAKETLSDLQEELADARDDFADNQEEIEDLQKENQKLNEQIGLLQQSIQDNRQEVELRLQRQQLINKQLSDNQ